MKHYFDQLLIPGILLIIISTLLLINLQNKFSKLKVLSEESLIFAEIDSELALLKNAARAIRSANPMREAAQRDSLRIRDELNSLFDSLYNKNRRVNAEKEVFIRLQTENWKILESNMQDLRSGAESSREKVLHYIDDIQRNLKKRRHLCLDQKKSLLAAAKLNILLYFITVFLIILCQFYLRYREKKHKKAILDYYTNLSLQSSSFDHTNKPIHTSTLLDSDENTQMEKAFRFCFEHFYKEMQTKDSFFASMSHEIRTPLNGLVGFLGNLNETPLNEQQRQYLRIIDSSARSLMHVINQILDYSKIQAGRLALEDIAFDLHSFVEERVAVAKQLAKHKSLRVHLEYTGEKPQIIRTDAGRLRQVLDNLLNNAVKFTDRGEVVLEVICKEDPANSSSLSIEFAVRDSGVGIPFDVQQKLFKPFAQADDTIARRYGGTGLGLNISSSLVKMMGAELSLSSRPGEGACFFFTLSALKAKPEEQVRISELYRVLLPRTELKKFWALLVDDTPTNLFLLETICQSVGLPYRTAVNGREALELCRKQRFDLIFMDIQMPIMDGYTAIREIRKLDNSARTHIIALTASAFQEDVDKALGAGSTGFIPKPFERDQLLLAIADALGVIPERKMRESQLAQESSENMVVRRMHDFMREQYQISLGEIKMILAQTVSDWRPVLDNLMTYAQQGNAEETIAILQRLKGQLVSIGLTDHSEQTVAIMECFQSNQRSKGQVMVTNFCQSLSRIFKVLEQEVTLADG